MDIIEEEKKTPFKPETNGSTNGRTKGSPPRTGTSRGPNADSPTMPQIQQSLEDFYILAGTMIGTVPNPRLKMVGDSIVSNGEKCAEAIVEAAKKDPKLKRALIKLTTAGAYSGIAIAHAPIIMAIYVAVQAPESAFAPPETVDAGDPT